MYQNVHTWGWQ